MIQVAVGILSLIIMAGCGFIGFVTGGAVGATLLMIAMSFFMLGLLMEIGKDRDDVA